MRSGTEEKFPSEREMCIRDRIMIETGKLAKQADGSVVVKQGDTMLLATVVAAKDARCV